MAIPTRNCPLVNSNVTARRLSATLAGGRRLWVLQVSVFGPRIRHGYATLAWVDWFNNRHLLKFFGNIPPSEAEANCYAALETEPAAA